MVKTEDITRIVCQALQELNEELHVPELDRPSPETPLYGSGSCLDSINLVSLISDIEGRLLDELGRHVVLADERAVSRARSPFRSVECISDYIMELLREPSTPPET